MGVANQPGVDGVVSMDSRSRSAPRPQRLTAAAVSGMGWSYSTTVGIAAIQLVYVTVMARLLDPVAFGIYAIAMLTVTMGNSFARMGLSQALIQLSVISRDDVRASATAGAVLGLLIFAVQWAAAPWVSRFFEEPDAIPILRAMGAHFIFLGLGVTSEGLLRRDLRFRQLSLAQFASYTIGYGVVGISLALLGAGVWSLACAVLTAQFLATTLQYVLTRHPLRPVLEVRRFGHLYGFGARISVLSLLEFFGRQFDTFAVGRYTSTALLGQYNRAFVVVNLPMSQQVSKAITRVIFPGFSKIQEDTVRLTRAYLSVLTLGGTLIFSVGAGMSVAAREIVLVVLGGQWDVAVALVPYFALAVSFNIMTKFAELVCEARAELNKVLVVQMTYLFALGAGYLAVSGFERVTLFAAVLACAEVVRHVAFMGLIRHTLDVSVGDVARAYAPAAVAAAVVAASVLAASQAARGDVLPVVAVLVLEIVAAVIALGIAVRMNPFVRVRTELHDRLRKSGLIDKAGGRARRAATLLVGRATAEQHAGRDSAGGRVSAATHASQDRRHQGDDVDAT